MFGANNGLFGANNGLLVAEIGLFVAKLGFWVAKIGRFARKIGRFGAGACAGAAGTPLLPGLAALADWRSWEVLGGFGRLGGRRSSPPNFSRSSLRGPRQTSHEVRACGISVARGGMGVRLVAPARSSMFAKLFFLFVSVALIELALFIVVGGR